MAEKGINIDIDRRFYVELYSSKHDDPTDKNFEVKYVAYAPKYGHPMALFSKVDGMPLAVLNLLFQDVRLYAKGCDSFLTELPSDGSKQLFQGVVTKDSQEVEFVITNLTDDYLNFDILKTDKKVDSVSSQGVNEINELRAYESVAIKSDQTCGNKVIMVKAFDNGAGGVMVKDEIVQAAEGKVGSYMYLSVVPKMGAGSCAKFADTFWKPIDCFVVKTRYPKMMYGVGVGFGFGHDSDIDSYLGRSERLESDDVSLNARYVPPSLRGAGAYNAVEESHRVSDSLVATKSGPKCASQSAAMPMAIPSIMPEAKVIEVKDQKQIMAHVMDSKVGNVITGDKVVAVSSVDTGVSYDYDKRARSCMFGVSVMEGFKIRALSHNELVKLAEELIKSYVTSTFKDLLSQMKVYASEVCCVCLTEKASAIFYRCGHKCTDSACGKELAKCPLCRMPVGALIDEAKTVVTATSAGIVMQIDN